MKRNVFYSAGILGALCMLLIGCVSIETERPFTEIYAGEEEPLLSEHAAINTILFLFYCDHNIPLFLDKSIDCFNRSSIVIMFFPVKKSKPAFHSEHPAILWTGSILTEPPYHPSI